MRSSASLFSGYDSTIWFIICHWPHEHLSDDVTHYVCKVAAHWPWSFRHALLAFTWFSLETWLWTKVLSSYVAIHFPFFHIYIGMLSVMSWTENINICSFCNCRSWVRSAADWTPSSQRNGNFCSCLFSDVELKEFCVKTGTGLLILVTLFMLLSLWQSHYKGQFRQRQLTLTVGFLRTLSPS